MPDHLDHIQDAQAAALDALQASARLPDAVPPAERDCVRCGSAIDPRRLRACPTAARCIDCEELEEVRNAIGRTTGRRTA